MKSLLIFFCFLGFSQGALSKNGPETLSHVCFEQLKPFLLKPNAKESTTLRSACEKVATLPSCTSVNGRPIFHFDRQGNHSSGQKILVFSLIHGDEVPAGMVGRYWLQRLNEIQPRNTWRVVPVLNPDGVAARTRTNANQVDINRNFPTADWERDARNYWIKDSNRSPRRFPGEKAASEPETRCALDHIGEFKPDFVVSIHTPLQVLDFDGPRVSPPKFEYLPWKSLGHYPGSLGRYLWFERRTPVLTAEFKPGMPPEKPLIELQDVIGYLVSLEIKKKSASAVDPAVE